VIAAVLSVIGGGIAAVTIRESTPVTATAHVPGGPSCNNASVKIDEAA